MVFERAISIACDWYEFVSHAEFASRLQCGFSFFNPCRHRWRVLKENANDLIRQYFQKIMDFSGIGKDQIKSVETLLNRRPRKCLNYETSRVILTQQWHLFVEFAQCKSLIWCGCQSVRTAGNDPCQCWRTFAQADRSGRLFFRQRPRVYRGYAGLRPAAGEAQAQRPAGLSPRYARRRAACAGWRTDSVTGQL